MHAAPTIDDRAWELVSPSNKHGAGIEAFFNSGSAQQASVSGNAFTYAASGPITTAAEGNRAVELTQDISVRGEHGWESTALTTPDEEVQHLRANELDEYKLFSDDLSLGLVSPRGNTPLPPLKAGADKTIYLRATTPNGGYLPLVTAENVVQGAQFGEEGILENRKMVRFIDATPDLGHVIFESSEKLTPEAVQAEFPDTNLYEWAAGSIHLVSDTGRVAWLGYEDKNVRHAMSDDGTRVIWTEQEPGEPRELMIRDTASNEAVRVDVRQQGVEPEEGVPIFQDASTDGSRVFFTDDESLTSMSHAKVSGGEESEDLYVFEAPRGGVLSAGGLKDLTVPLNEGETAGVQGAVLGSGANGEYVYFVANGVLAAGATPGACRSGGRLTSPGATCNLYVDRYDSGAGGWERPKFIATLANTDESNWVGASFRRSGEVGLSADVSSNGQFLAFMSGQELTGYDNHDAVSGASDQEVYVYDAALGGLVCASCNPTGERPVGVHESSSVYPYLLVDSSGMFSEEWLAGSITGWISLDQGGESAPVYQPRYLSDEGRVFFNSADNLVPADHNGVEDVYEYQPGGVGPAGEQCGQAATSSSDVFRPARVYEAGGATSVEAAGCVGLISSGTSSLESVFLDASVGGGDAFFLTAAQLTTNDVDSAYDVYDAHACTAASPCETLTPPEQACESLSACRGSLGVPSSGLESPVSMAAPGAGNVEPLLPKKKTAAETRAQRLAKALSACRKRRPRQRRVVCERHARKLYGRVARRAPHAARTMPSNHGRGK